MGRTLLVALLFFLAPLCCGQTACPPLQAPASDPSKLLITSQQEMALGEFFRQQYESEFLAIDDDAVVAYLRRVGERVARHLPDTGLHYEFLLYDQPEIQAFGMPGGRVYVSRKMVAFLRNEDELAGLIGHELGHMAARQQALEVSQQLRDVLGVKGLSDDDDLFEKYNELIDHERMKKRHSSPEGDENKSQMVADQLGVQAVARAGYLPQAYPDFLDRLMQTRGKTGSWFSDLFGATPPDSKRLRESLKDVSSLPPACIEAKQPGPTDEFRQWQTAVLNYRGIGHSERLSSVLTRRQLRDPLRGDVEDFRFSPDGKYLLARDEGGIYILTRDPLKFLFRIDSPGAGSAQFSPNSRQVVFFSSGLNVETWDIERQERTSLADVPALRGCRQTALSPDARYLACFNNSLELLLYDVATGESIFKKEKFFDFDSGLNAFGGFFKLIYFLSHPEVTTLRFSPDGHYFAASSRTREAVVIDLTTYKKINVPGAVQQAIEYSFTFLGPDRILGVNSENPQKSPLVQFPSGKVLDRLPLGGASLAAATNPRYVMLRPLVDRPVGVLDLEQKKLAYSNRMSATDVWGDVSASERLTGEIGLYKISESTTKNVLQLPLGKLGALKTFVASPDLKWIAMSSRTRGGVWDLVTNQCVFHGRGFQNAYYTTNSLFFMDFPQFEKADREMVVLSPVTGQTKGRPVNKDDDIAFFGDVYLQTKHNGKGNADLRNIELDALDMINQKPLWSRSFPKQGPRVSGSPSSGKLVLSWSVGADGLRDEVARNASLQARFSRENPGNTDYFFEVLNTRDGQTAGGVVLRTGKLSFVPEYTEAVGDWLIVGDNRNRVLLYSISTGEQKAKWFGYHPEISRNGERLCLLNGRGRLLVYDLRSLKQIRDFSFASHISAETFSDDAKKLLVLTDDQTAFVIDVSGAPSTATAARR
jgi:Peptidase family M48